MRFHGVDNNGEELSSAYVDHDPATFGFATTGPSLTRQEFAAECDINTIMATYEATGVISHVNRATPQYLDVTDVPDLAEAIRIVDEATTAFMTLPATARKEFDNDPVKFVQAVQDGDDAFLERMRGWGLAEPAPKEPAPTRVEIVNPTPAPSQGAGEAS